MTRAEYLRGRVENAWFSSASLRQRAPFLRRRENVHLATLYHGAAGAAYSVYRIARKHRDRKLLAFADVSIERAFAHSITKDAFRDPELGITPDTVGRISLFHSKSGLHFVRALISTERNDIGLANAAIRAFVAGSRKPCESADLTLGKASLLIGCAELLEATAGSHGIDAGAMLLRGREIACELACVLRSKVKASSKVFKVLGVAHGQSGLVFALLRWSRIIGCKPDPIVLTKLDQLTSLAKRQGRTTRWPLNNVGPYLKYGWCNGTAGLVMLFVLAEQVLAKERFGEVAESCVSGLSASCTPLGCLCCGLGGIAYAFAAVHRMTGSRSWLNRARAVASRAQVIGAPLRYSLYQGALGIAFLAEDLKQPSTAAMPLFEPLPELPQC